MSFFARQDRPPSVTCSSSILDPQSGHLGFLGQINIVKITTEIQKGAINFMPKQNRRMLLGWQDWFQCVSSETPLLLSNHINNAPHPYDCGLFIPIELAMSIGLYFFIWYTWGRSSRAQVVNLDVCLVTSQKGLFSNHFISLDFASPPLLD